MKREQPSLGRGQQCQAVQKLMDVFRSNSYHLELQLQSYIALGVCMKLVFCPVVCSTRTSFWICSLGRSRSVSHRFTVDRDKTINRCSVYNIFFLIQQWLFNLLAKAAEFANWHLINAMSASLGHPPVNKFSASYWNSARWWTNVKQGWLAGPEEPQNFRDCPPLRATTSPIKANCVLSCLSSPSHEKCSWPTGKMSEPVKLARATKKEHGNFFPALMIGTIRKKKKNHNQRKTTKNPKTTQKTKQKERGSHYPPCWVEAKLIKKAAGEGTCHKISLQKHGPFLLFFFLPKLL